MRVAELSLEEYREIMQTEAVLEGLAAGGPVDGRVVTVGVTAMPGSGSPEQLRDWAGISRGRIAARVRELLA